MSDWEYFPLEEETRPDLGVVFKPEERAELERTVSEQVALLLSYYGDIEAYAVDEDRIVFFNVLELGDEELEDGTLFTLTQLPPDRSGKWDVSPGVYSILHTTTDEVPIRYLTVHDTSHEVDRFIYDHHGDPVELSVLQELYDVLAVLTRDYLDYIDPNSPAYDPTEFPVQVSGPKAYFLADQIIDAPDYEPDLSDISLN